MPDPTFRTAPHAAPGGATRLLRFGLVGASGVLVNLTVLAFLVEVIGWHAAIAGVVSIEASTLTNWALNRAWTWRDRDRSLASILSYHAVSFVGLAAQWSVLAAATALFGVHWLPASLAGVAVGTAWNFMANHRFTFQAYTPERRRRHVRVAAYALAAVLHVLLAAVLAHEWDVFVFQRSTEDFLQHGTTPYETGAAEPSYVYAAGLPVQALWYAYPPLPLLLMAATYWPAALGLASSPWLGRVLIKAPFLAGNLLLAWSGHRLVASDHAPDAGRRARRLEALLLFNPLIVAIAVVWGQFESLLTALLILSVIAMRVRRHATAGAAWGAALLLKPFALVLAPLLLLHLVRVGGLRAPFRYFFAGLAVFAVVSLPFWLLHPDGFLQQVVLMHTARPPSGLAPLAIVHQGLVQAGRGHPGLLPSASAMADAIGLLAVLMTAFVVLMVAAASLRRPPTERSLLFAMAVTLTAALLASKVLNEQYVVMPLALTAASLALGCPWLARAGLRRAKGLVVTASVLMPAALLVDKIHIVRFLPDDVLTQLVGASAPRVIAAWAHGLGTTVGEFHMAASFVTAALLVPVLLNAAALAAPAVLSGFTLSWERLVRLVVGHDARRTGFRTALVLSLALIVMPSIAMGGLAPRTETPDPAAGVVGRPIVLAEYATHWFNPLRRPETPAGPWHSVEMEPAAGFFQPNAKKYETDVRTIRDAGFDGLLIRFHPGFEAEASTLSQLAEAHGVPHALAIDLRDLTDPETGTVPLTAATAEAAHDLLDGPGPDYWRPGAHVRESTTSGHLIVVRGVDAVRPTFTAAETRWVAEQAGLSAGVWRGGGEVLDDAARESAVWRQAYAVALDRWWSTALDVADDRTSLSLVADGPVPVPVELAHRIEVAAVQGLEAGGLDADASAAYVHLVAARPDDVAAYDAAWARAVGAEGAAIVVAWNDFGRGTAVEPTRAHGDVLLRRTQAWNDVFDVLGSDAAHVVPLLPARHGAA